MSKMNITRAVSALLVALGLVGFLSFFRMEENKVEENLVVLIYETDANASGAKAMVEQVNRLAGVSARIFGQGEEYKGFSSKYNALAPILEGLDRDQLVIVSDGRDVLLNNPIQHDTYVVSAAHEFQRNFAHLTAGYPNAIVASAEAQCCVSALTHAAPGNYFDETMHRTQRACASGEDGCNWVGDEEARPWETFMQELAKESGTEDVYLNAGLLAGRALDLLNVVHDMDLLPSEDDQAVLTDYMYRRPESIRLDYSQTLFGNNRVELEEDNCMFRLEENRMVHVQTSAAPLFVHSPGGEWKCHDKIARDLGMMVDEESPRKLTGGSCNYGKCSCPAKPKYPDIKKCELKDGEIKIEFENKEYKWFPKDYTLTFKGKYKYAGVWDFSANQGYYEGENSSDSSDDMEYKKWYLGPGIHKIYRMEKKLFDEDKTHKEFNLYVKNDCGSKQYICENKNLTPIGLDIDGSGAVEAIRGKFEIDIDGDVLFETLDEWFAPTEGILIDASIGLENGVNGKHLFGNQGGAFKNGFDKLSVRDTNGDGMVTGDELAGLAVWMDVNSNAKLDEGELSSLESHNIVGLNTKHSHFKSTAILEGGSRMVMEDLYFSEEQMTTDW